MKSSFSKGQSVVIKFITKSLRPLGLFLIFIFATVSIFSSLFMQDIDTSTFFSKLLDFTVSFENRFYDYRMRNLIAKNNFVSKDIVLLNIDDYSLQEIGIWPIPRTIHAEMLNKLKTFGAKVVALDILYPEKAPICGPENPDKVFAEAIRNFQKDGNRVFMAWTTAQSQREVLEEAPLEMLNDMVNTRSSPGIHLLPKKIGKYTFPIEELVATEVGLGSIDSTEDRDGIFRRYPLVHNVDEIYYGSLGFNAFKAFRETNPPLIIWNDGTAELDFEGKKLELNTRGEIKVRFIGGEEAFPSVPIYDLLKADDQDLKMKKIFKDKIVFVGSTALGAHDLRPTPLDAKTPGVFMHINTAHMLLHQYFYQNTDNSIKISLYYLIGGMLLILLLQRLGNALLDALLLVGLVAVGYFADREYFLPKGYELKLFYCYFCFGASYSWITFLNFSQAAKEKKQIKGTFARYVAPTIVDEMLKDPDKLHVGGFKTDITCLFSDVRDFTAISEGLTPTELAHSLNMYMGKMTDIVFQTQGTLDKYIGDAIVAFWGAPLPIGNHAQYAVEGAIQMINILPAINEEFKKLGRPEFKVGIGLNSGECSVGNMGSERIFSYTALGDNMNLGARLEGLCKYYGSQILISEFTLERIDRHIIKTRPIDKVKVKGKTKPVSIFEVLHDHHPMTKNPDHHLQYLKGYEIFLQKNFAEALNIFQALPQDDIPTKRLRDLCLKYTDHPELVTENFDVTTMTEK